MTDPALDTLPEWPWPRWEFVTAMPDDDGVTVAMVPVEMVGSFCFAADEPGRRWDAVAYGPVLTAGIDGRLLDSTGAENTFDG